MRLFKGRCPDCGKITPVKKLDWYKSVRCQWCGRRFVPFATANKRPTIRETYEKNKVSKSIAKWSEKELGRKVA